MDEQPSIGDFVEVRARRWLVEGRDDVGEGLSAIRVACIDDDAQGEPLQVNWAAELDARILDQDAWGSLARDGTDDPEVFAAYLRTLEWNTATAADRDLFQAPFRAGIRLDAYQLQPLRKALRLPRVNLLIADDVGLGKTVEAGLILREMLLRRRLDFVLVAAPAGMIPQWKDELETKFGLSFTVLDREYLATIRRSRGFSANPWAVGSRFLISHTLLADETYAAGLRDRLGVFCPRALLILDEAHHAAPSSGRRYAIDSQFTRAIRGLAGCFEHRLFLTATPHNGHSNSFSALLEMLDPQRFIRGDTVQPADLEPIMVRRLKVDLRRLGEPFPERIVEPIALTGLPSDAPELVLPRRLEAYRKLREARLAHLPPAQATRARLVWVGLQQRLLSSIAAFASTLKVHRKGLLEKAPAALSTPETFVAGPPSADEVEPSDETAASESLQLDEEALTEAATHVGNVGATASDLQSEIALVDEMLAIAEQHRNGPDARVNWLNQWVRANLAPDGIWNSRRLILFTEWETTRRWLERRLTEALGDLDPEDRIASFTGATSSDRREALKRAFNADPASEKLRILICTDAAREGINLQAHCHDLIHIDLPWNPSRLEQRNGRIDRKLQPSPQVWCRYFVFEQREEDIVLKALEKTERIRKQLGSAGQVIGERIAERLRFEGINRPREQAAALAVEDEDERAKTARTELDDAEDRRRQRLAREVDDLRGALEASRERVGDGTGWIRGRGGKQFDPAAFPFLQGQATPDDPPRVPGVSDGAVLRVLDGLLTLDGERLSYRTLDVEQIGSVYETVMGFTVTALNGPALAIKAGRNNRTPVFVDLADLLSKKGAERLKTLKEDANRSGTLSARQAQPITGAATEAELAAALAPLVDERGSPRAQVWSPGTPLLQPTDERRRTGSHYTPRELTNPIVEHALKPAFERLGEDATPEQVLSLKVCDPAMGSGAFLVEACRQIAARLVQAWTRHAGTRPPLAADEDEDLLARRLVAQRCLYGVDRNPMAVDLARLSLWVATLARDHEFTFLDHALKAGDSLVG